MRSIMPFIFAIAIALVGCGDSSNSNNDDGSNNDPANNNPANNDPSNNDPANNDPANNDPANNDPANNSPLAGCAGNYMGTFDGDDMGLAAGTLDADGTLTLTFTTSLGEVNSTGEVTAEGDVSGTEASTTVTGTMDFDTCTMSGDWVTVGFGNGTWEASRS